MLERLRRGALELLLSTELAERGFLVAFTGSEGGVSEGPFASLNLSYNVDDEKERVDANRLEVAEAIGIPVTRWVLPRQVHGAGVARVGPMEAGRGSRDYPSGIPRTDALVTGTADLALAVLTADCVPLVMVDETQRSVAVVHAGWRGVLAGTPKAAYSVLSERAGRNARHVLVFIGPHIRSCCMEVAEDLARAFENGYGEGVAVRFRNRMPHLNLEEACVRMLARGGVPRSNIFTAGQCTSCGEGYFSFRGSSGRCGRQGAFAAVIG